MSNENAFHWVSIKASYKPIVCTFMKKIFKRFYKQCCIKTSCKEPGYLSDEVTISGLMCWVTSKLIIESTSQKWAKGEGCKKIFNREWWQKRGRMMSLKGKILFCKTIKILKACVRYFPKT